MGKNQSSARLHTRQKTVRHKETCSEFLTAAVIEPDARRFCLFHTAAGEGWDLSQTNHFHSDCVCTLKRQRLIGLHLRVTQR